MIEVKNLSKFFLTHKGFYYYAINNISFKIKNNEVVGLVGESGSGKTTLARLLVKIEEASKGDIFFEGINITNLSENELLPFRKKMQIVFQDPFSSLNPKLKIQESLMEGLFNFYPELKKDIILNKLKDGILSIGLTENDLKKYPHEFSGGQRQRIAILRALLVNPEFLICDEIVSALDVSVRGTIMNILKDLKDNANLSLLFISHDLALTNMVSDKIMVMLGGNIVEIIPKSLLFESKHPYTQFLVSHSFKNDSNNYSKKCKPIHFFSKDDFNNANRCPYYSYCINKKNICLTEKPKLKILDNNHEVYCHLYK